MITEIRIPQVGTNDELVTLLEWSSKDGTWVRKGETIYLIETIKVLFEVEAPRDGYLRIDQYGPRELPTQSVVGWIVDAPEERPQAHEYNEKTTQPLATKKAQQLIESLGLKLEEVPHSGILKEKDVLNYMSVAKKGAQLQGLPPALDRKLIDRMEPMSSIQKQVSEKVISSFRNNVSAYLSIEVNIEKASHGLQKIVDSTKKIVRLNDLIIKGTSHAIEEFQLLNAFYWEGKIVYYRNIDINIIMSNRGNLIAPVIRDACRKTIEEIAYESTTLQMKAHRNQLTPDDLKNGTFTISNLSSFGVRDFIPVINVYQSAILGVSGERSICAIEGNQVKQTRVVNLGLTYDHRIINGVMGANFLNNLKKFIEAFE